jgi:septum formation protein
MPSPPARPEVAPHLLRPPTSDLRFDELPSHATHGAVILRVPLILASASPRRSELLREVVADFRVVTAEGVEESHEAGWSPSALTEHNARLKAAAVQRQHPGALVLGADTLVYLGGEPLGKPASVVAAADMLRKLSGRTHEVCTGVCLAGPAPDDCDCFHDLTEVSFRRLSEAEIDDYLTRVPVLDKAGAYAIQEHGDMIIEQIRGSRTNVIGLPLEVLRLRLARWSSSPAVPAD